MDQVVAGALALARRMLLGNESRPDVPSVAPSEGPGTETRGDAIVAEPS